MMAVELKRLEVNLAKVDERTLKLLKWMVISELQRREVRNRRLK